MFLTSLQRMTSYSCLPSDTTHNIFAAPIPVFLQAIDDILVASCEQLDTQQPKSNKTSSVDYCLLHGIRLQQLEMAVRGFQLAEFIRTIHNKFLIIYSPYPIVLWTKAIPIAAVEGAVNVKEPGTSFQRSSHRSGVCCDIKYKFCCYSKHIFRKY